MPRPEQLQILKVTAEHVAGVRDHMIISVALGTALREAEIHHLQIGDVIRDGHVLNPVKLRWYKGIERVPASESAARARARMKQQVFVPRACRIKLAKFMKWKKKRGESLAPTAPLFVAAARPQNGNEASPVSTRTLRHLWREWQKRARFETLYPFHVLRHTSLSNLYHATKDLRLVQNQARHMSSVTTEIYTHVDDDTRIAVEGMPA